MSGNKRRSKRLLDKFAKKFNACTSESCNACLLDFEEDDDKIAFLDCCEHVFHEQCIITWAKQENKCTQCKKRFRNVGVCDKSGNFTDTIPIVKADQVADEDSEEEIIDEACIVCGLTTGSLFTIQNCLKRFFSVRKTNFRLDFDVEDYFCDEP